MSEDLSSFRPVTDSTVKPDDTRGWITPLVARFSDFCNQKTTVFIPARLDSQKHQSNGTFIRHRTRAVDTFVARLLFFDILAYSVIVGIPLFDFKNLGVAVAKCMACAIVTAFVWLHFLNIIGVTFRIALFDSWFNPPDLPPSVASHPRIIVLGLINFVQLMFIFGTIYALDPNRIAVPDGTQRDWLDPLYFSCIAQTTIGFGDRYPMGWLRVRAMLQSVSVFSFVVVFITRAVGTMSPIRSIEDENRRSTEEQWPPSLTF